MVVPNPLQVLGKPVTVEVFVVLCLRPKDVDAVHELGRLGELNRRVLDADEVFAIKERVRRVIVFVRLGSRASTDSSDDDQPPVAGSEDTVADSRGGHVPVGG